MADFGLSGIAKNKDRAGTAGFEGHDMGTPWAFQGTVEGK
jgi:hypothetical protein